MKILAIESSGMTAGIAIVEDEKLVAEYSVNYKKTHSQTLVPMLDEVSNMTELDLSSLDAIAISKGPGSYTGLRIGSATAKGLGLALNKPLVEVPTLDALAYNMVGTDRLVCPMIDARREEVFTGLYEFDKEKEIVLMESTSMPVKELLQKIEEMGRPVLFLGDGVDAYRELLESVKADYMIAPASRRNQSAASVATLGMELLKEGKTVLARDHVPEYLKVSQAERERNERQSENKA